MRFDECRHVFRDRIAQIARGSILDSAKGVPWANVIARSDDARKLVKRNRWFVASWCSCPNPRLRAVQRQRVDVLEPALYDRMMETLVGAPFVRRGALGAATALALAFGCSDSADTSASAHAPGSEQGPCLEGDACNDGLVCLSHTCVALGGSGGAGGASGSSGAGGSGGSAGRGGGSSGATSGGAMNTAGANGVDGGTSGGAANGGTGGDAGGGTAGRDSSVGGSGGSAGTSGGSAGTGGGSAGTGGGSAGTGGATGGRGGAGGGVCSDGGCTCTPTSLLLLPAPLDIYVLFDQSLSMNDNVAGGSKWSVMTGALSTFVQGSISNGIHMGIGYFPLIVPGAPPQCANDVDCGQYGPCSGMICQKADPCVANNYAPDVPIALLPGASQLILDSLAAHAPNGFTPTYPALRATYQYVRGWASGHRSDQTIVVLATDGDPTFCDASTNNVNTIATTLVAPALAGDPSVETFVIGVGSSLTSMNQIAAAGGTQQAFLVDTTGPDAGSQFLGAMTAITQSPLLACEYRIPSLTDGGAVDLGKASVHIKMPSGPPATVAAVPDRSGCTVSTGGWYFDNSQRTPEKIVLCNSTCTALRGTSGATAELAVGCAAP